MTHPILDGVKCVVFDVDDTLYLERDYAQSGFEAVGLWAARELGIAGVSELSWRKFGEGVRRTIFNDVLDELGIDYEVDTIEEIVAVYRGHAPDIELLPDALGCLESLANDFQLAALTGGPLVCQRAKVRALELEARFRPLIYARQWGAEFDKPHPRSFEELEKLSGFGASQLIYVADNPHKDFEAPLELGWRTVRVRREGSLHEAIDCGTAVHLEVASLAPLLKRRS